MNRGDSGSYKSSVIALNKLLDKCGMPRLDSRHPFDWLVMNAFYVSEKSKDDTINRMKVLYEKIFNAGNPESQFQLALIYFEGKGVEKNLYEAKVWAEKAVLNGWKSAKPLLERILRSIAAIDKSTERGEEKK